MYRYGDSTQNEKLLQFAGNMRVHKCSFQNYMDFHRKKIFHFRKNVLTLVYIGDGARGIFMAKKPPRCPWATMLTCITSTVMFIFRRFFLPFTPTKNNTTTPAQSHRIMTQPNLNLHNIGMLQYYQYGLLKKIFKIYHISMYNVRFDTRFQPHPNSRVHNLKKEIESIQNENICI